MFALRCTAKLLKRMPEAPGVPPESTTLLGDWYATILYARPQQLVLAVSARTFLPVLITAKDPSMMLHRLRSAVGKSLRALGVSEEAVGAELLEMNTAVVSKTVSRSIVGTMNEMVFLLGGEQSGSLLDLSLDLSRTPYGALPAVFPERAVERLFGLRPSSSNQTPMV